MNKFILFFFLLVTLYISAQKRLDFIEEKIDFKIDSERFYVNGIYYFINHSDTTIRQAILFPVQKESDSVVVKRVYNLTYNENIHFSYLNHAISFRFSMLPNDTLKINIAYSQKTDKENIYILETTQAWGKPLEQADYALTFDDSVTIEKLSLKPDTLIGNVYYWSMKEFFPNENFKVVVQ